MQYEYKVVPFIGNIKSGEGADIAAGQLQAVITKYSNAGWEFVQMGDVNIAVQPGCFAAFFGHKETCMRFDQIVFRRYAEGT